MSPESIRLFWDLMQSPAFRQAMSELCAREIDNRTTSLRAAVRMGNVTHAALTEGEIAAFESLMPLFRHYADKYSQ